MSAILLAKALGRGVEVAAMTPFSEFENLLKTGETMTDTVIGEDSSAVATFELLAVQRFDEPTGKSIEVRVLASDGYGQLVAYFYAKPEAQAAM